MIFNKTKFKLLILIILFLFFISGCSKQQFNQEEIPVDILEKNVIWQDLEIDSSIPIFKTVINEYIFESDYISLLFEGTLTELNNYIKKLENNDFKLYESFNNDSVYKNDKYYLKLYYDSDLEYPILITIISESDYYKFN